MQRSLFHFKNPFFSEYQWMWSKYYRNMSQSVIQEEGFFDYIFGKKNRYNDWTEEEYNRAKNFGEIMTEYMIRTKGYSLITTDVRKSIVPSEQNCSKKFEEYIEQGYHIHRLAKTIYKPSIYDLFGKWQFLPVFPINNDNLSCEVNEYIETRNKQLIKVSKY